MFPLALYSLDYPSSLLSSLISLSPQSFPQDNSISGNLLNSQ